MPILGFPSSFKNIFYIAVGIVLIVLSYKWGDTSEIRKQGEAVVEKTFAENKPMPKMDSIYTNESN
jgi:hypothetical protein